MSVFRSPVRIASGPFPFLYLAANNKEVVAAADGADAARTKRNVFARDALLVAGTFSDPLAGLLAGASVEVRKVSTSGIELTFPFTGVLDEFDLAEVTQDPNVVRASALPLHIDIHIHARGVRCVRRRPARQGGGSGEARGLERGALPGDVRVGHGAGRFL